MYYTCILEANNTTFETDQEHSIGLHSLLSFVYIFFILVLGLIHSLGAFGMEEATMRMTLHFRRFLFLGLALLHSVCFCFMFFYFFTLSQLV